jgi:PAS domain S-box-containing protein
MHVEKRPLRVLLVEDSDDDALLVTRELQRGEYELVVTRVETAQAFESALRSGDFHVILSDYSLPSFSAPEAIRLLRASKVDLPLLIVSGTMGEETAVEAMRAGANDFLVKHRLARLRPAIEREIREAEDRRARRQVEQDLEASEKRFLAVVENAADAIVSVDAAGAVIQVNPAATTMFAYSAEELRGLPFSSLVPQSVSSDGRAPFDLDVRTENSLRLVEEAVGLRKGGVEFPIEVSVARWKQDTRVYFTAIVRDISERKRIEAQLLVSDRMASVGTLAAGVAHEINNPLTAVVANLELAEEEAQRLGLPTERAELASLLVDARSAADRVRKIVKDLKLFSRVDEDKRDLVDLESVLESSLRIAATEIRHRARLVRDYRPVAAVVANESRLSQVFLNLIVNAAQAIRDGRVEENEIRVATGTDERGRVFVDIADTGAGMTPEVMKHLFTPFFTTKPPGEGTGLGLSICRRLVADHGGEILVESRPGRGTVFRVALPAATRTALAEISEAPVEEPLFGRARVLVIDDELLIASVIERVLRPIHDVVVAKDALDALRRIGQGEEFDAILCDVMMPKMSGAQFYEELNRFRPAMARAIAFVSGGAFTPSARAFLDSVPNARMEKPFDALQLRKIVNGLVSDA